MLSRVEELKLISRCVLGDDRAAFGALVEAYQPRLRRFFLNLTLGDEALSDDLAQETFIKAYIELRSFRGMARFSTWLFRIGYNEFYSHKRREHATQGLDGIVEPHDNPIDASEAGLDVKAAMALLNEVERTVVTLFYIDDMPLKQVAKVMNVKESTLRSHLHRAREKMARTLSYSTSPQH